MMDIQGLHWLGEKLRREDKLDSHSHLIESTLVTYVGNTVFSLFEEHHEKLLDFMLLYENNARI